MKHEYSAEITWTSDEGSFVEGRYTRAHQWKFDGGIEIPASASPLNVPLPYSREDAVDPEEAYIAAISSCHMLSFLWLASKKKIDILSYHDRAVGFMEPNSNGKLTVTLVNLYPVITYAGIAPEQSIIDALHHAAHEECFIANSVKTEIKVCHPAE